MLHKPPPKNSTGQILGGWLLKVARRVPTTGAFIAKEHEWNNSYLSAKINTLLLHVSWLWSRSHGFVELGDVQQPQMQFRLPIFTLLRLIVLSIEMQLLYHLCPFCGMLTKQTGVLQPHLKFAHFPETVHILRPRIPELWPNADGQRRRRRTPYALHNMVLHHISWAIASRGLEEAWGKWFQVVACRYNFELKFELSLTRTIIIELSLSRRWDPGCILGPVLITFMGVLCWGGVD